jgi:hypothetical protein
MTKSRYVSRKLQQFLLFCFALIILSSCYSVRVVNKNGSFVPDPLNQSPDFYRGMEVHQLDTTISLKLTEGEFHLIERCSTGGFYSFEYRVTFGGVLLSAITFGKKRKVKIKYVCLKEQN